MTKLSANGFKPTFYWIISSLVFAIGLFTPYILAPYGMNLTDEPYHLMNYYDPLSGPLVLFNSLILKSLTGSNNTESIWLIYRCINIAFSQLAILAAATFMVFITRKRQLSICLAGLLLFTSGILKDSHYNLIGFNCLPIFISVLTTITFLIYYKSANKLAWIILIAGIFSGLLSMCYLPSGIIMLIGIIVIIAKNLILDKNIQRLFYHLLIYFAGIVIVGATCIYLFAKIDSTQYFSLIINNIATVRNHNINDILRQYFQDFIGILIYVSILWSISLITQFSLKQNSSKIHNLLVETSIFVIASIFLYFLYFVPIHTLPLLNASVILLFCYSLYINRHSEGVLFALITIFVCGFTVMSGSNTGFSKYIGFASVPLIFSYTIAEIKQLYTRKTIAFMVIFVCFNVAAFAIRKNHVTTFFDDSISRVNVKMHEPKYPMINGLYTTPERAELVHNIITDFSPYTNQSGREILVIGNDHKRFFYQYIFNARDIKMRHAWDYKNYYHDPEYLAYIREMIQGPKSMAVLYLHSEKDGIDNPMYKLLNDSLMRDTIIAEGPYSIFVRN